VDSVNVNLGDKVTSDQELATLREDTLPQNIILAKADLVTAQRNLQNLKESASAQAQAEQAVVQAQRAVDDAQKKVNSLTVTRATQNTLDRAESDYILAKNDVAKIDELWARVKTRDPDDPLRAQVLQQLTAAVDRRDKALQVLNWYKGKPEQIDIDEANANLAVAKAQLADAQREWDRQKNGPDPDDIAAAEARVTAIQATLNLANLNAPFAATITDASIKPGDSISPGSAAFRLDDFSHMLVDVQVSEVDINRIRSGQDVTMTFDAILGKEYHGKVSEVAKVGSSTQGTVNFTVTVELTDPDENVRPGMTAAVNIIVDQLQDALLLPNRAVRLKEGQRVAYTLVDGQLKSVPVKLGASSDTMSELVSSDLKAGDLVVLNPPAEFTSSGGFMGPPGN
jgi:HlyD family secretion protein